MVGTSISQRPKGIHKRESFGHWELDTVVSSRGKSKACVATFIERKTRMYVALKILDRTAYSMEVACGVVASQYPKAAFQSATVDRGKEFACYHASFFDSGNVVSENCRCFSSSAAAKVYVGLV
ncbi:IS30 family transposase [Paenibacillus sp. MER TA 81-3]|uniref:IS30 family transposase n=1 Tax=Paenibacillus sp. MER TA 81-3 TaxID=2939573 RepID=UPI00204227F2|nr:IS30 family transposase [Paenibacillus sp. MER TA 81-3]MCM3339948.1 IS30 family transposase [Paenibacillus sp. MER TA 81-3]